MLHRLVEAIDKFVSPATKRISAIRNCIDIELRRRYAKLSWRAEHWGFVSIAAVDAFHLHNWLVVVSLWLLVTGLAMEFFGIGDLA